MRTNNFLLYLTTVYNITLRQQLSLLSNCRIFPSLMGFYTWGSLVISGVLHLMELARSLDILL